MAVNDTDGRDHTANTLSLSFSPPVCLSVSTLLPDGYAVAIAATFVTIATAAAELMLGTKTLNHQRHTVAGKITGDWKRVNGRI